MKTWPKLTQQLVMSTLRLPRTISRWVIVNCGRAIELSPSLALAHQYFGVSLMRQGRLDEGLEESLKARELDPLSSIIARTVAMPYYLKRDYVRALELLRQANELGPPFSVTVGK